MIHADGCVSVRVRVTRGSERERERKERGRLVGLEMSHVDEIEEEKKDPHLHSVVEVDEVSRRQLRTTSQPDY